MNRKSTQLISGVMACISMLFLVAEVYGAAITIGGDYTDIGTIIIVSPKPGDMPIANGTALRNTLAGIMDNTETNPYLIKLGPGIYDLEASSLQMKQYVDIEGSGENTTTIKGTIGLSNSGVLKGANNAEIRFLTIQNVGGGSFAIAVYNDGASPKMTNVTALASGGSANNRGISNNSSSPMMMNVTVKVSGTAPCAGISNTSSSPKMTNLTVTVSGGTDSNTGVSNLDSSPVMTNVTVDASGYCPSQPYCFTYGISSNGSGTVKIDNSVVKGPVTLFTTPNVTALVGNTRLEGVVVNAGGTNKCAGAYNADYVALDASCH